MILCVTLNPCLDKTLTVPAWQPGDSVRGQSVREVVGGKGNNVARALKRLGRTARPVTFLGGPVGDHCAALLQRDDGLDPLITSTEALTRVILTVRTEHSPLQTAFFDPDPAVTVTEAEALFHRVEGALAEGTVTALTLSGSSPAPVTHGLYSDLIALARSRRIPVFLDTYGPALEAIWGFWPEVIQLNRREAALHLRKPTVTDADVLGMLESWSRHGVRYGLVTDGPGPVLIRHRNTIFRATPPSIDAVNPIGSGDCLLAGLADAWLSGLDPEATLRHAVGSAVANALVWDAGAIDPEEVKRQGEAVEIAVLD
ncbi:1-phosphofructokinase/tagatose 6-phosphate kinase [Singulisphaera sp. GP187]|uniref:1-phosphofructokinase family hexose kinase n=1 Tax=Singulisphaera sp. GP187 TaxID=1882752 RepID=UPI000928B178|nr:PfkB family carbohydrate kinase [Singulisphaera sp. GP187]SIO08838.1 1-phosphofructokinase/tagatose 6-phosphate kinase [Singulisphaera sp. GP187]